FSGGRFPARTAPAPPRPQAEDALELVGRRHLELVVAAVPRTFVPAPAHEVRGVAEAVTLHVVIGDLADALGPERDPGEVLAPVPPAPPPPPDAAPLARLPPA